MHRKAADAARKTTDLLPGMLSHGTLLKRTWSNRGIEPELDTVVILARKAPVGPSGQYAERHSSTIVTGRYFKTVGIRKVVRTAGNHYASRSYIQTALGDVIPLS